MTIENMDRWQAWEGFVGSQTPADFMYESRRDNPTATVEEAVAAYVADLSNIFPDECGNMTEADKRLVARMLREVIEESIAK